MSHTIQDENLETQWVYVRRLLPSDLEPVIALDARLIGRRRDEYFRVKLDMAMKETGVEVSLAAELDGIFTGFLIARVFYGEYGITEPVAVLDVVRIPKDLPPGDYILGWRYDCEATAQVWSNCADVKLHA